MPDGRPRSRRSLQRTRRRAAALSVPTGSRISHRSVQRDRRCTGRRRAQRRSSKRLVVDRGRHAGPVGRYASINGMRASGGHDGCQNRPAALAIRSRCARCNILDLLYRLDALPPHTAPPNATRSLDSRPDSTSCAAPRRRAAVVVLLSLWAANQQTCWAAVCPYHQDGPQPGGSGPGPARRARRRRRAQRHLRAGHERRRGRARDGDGEAHGLEGPREPHGAHPGAGEEQTAHEAALDPRAARGRRAERDVGRRGGAARRVRRGLRGRGGRGGVARPAPGRLAGDAARAQRDANHARGSSEAAVARTTSPELAPRRRGLMQVPRHGQVGRRDGARPRRGDGQGPRGLRRQVRGRRRRRAPRAADAPPAARGRRARRRAVEGLRARRRRRRARGARGARAAPARAAGAAAAQGRAGSQGRAAGARRARRGAPARSEGAAARKCGAGRASWPAGAQAGY